MASAEYLEELITPLLAQCTPGFERITAMRRLTGGANSEIYSVASSTGGRYCLRCRTPNPKGSPLNPQQISLPTEARLLRLCAAGDTGVPNSSR